MAVFAGFSGLGYGAVVGLCTLSGKFSK